MSFSRPLKNLIAVFAGRILSKLFGLVTAMILARYLGPEDYGKYAFIITFAFIFTVISDFGLNDLFVRDIAKNREVVSKYFAFGLIVKPVISIAGIISLIISVYLMGYSQEIILSTIVYSIHIIFVTLTNSIASIFRAYEKMEFASLISLIGAMVGLVFISILVYYEGTLLQVILVKVIAFFIGFLIGLILLLKYIAKPDFSIDFVFIKIHLLKALPFLTIGLIHALYFNIDIIMLSKMQGDIYVGWYTPAAMDLFFGILIIPATVTTVIYPMFSRHYSESIVKLRNSLNFTLKVLILLAVPICVGTYILASQIIILIFGEQYTESIIVLQIIALAILFAFIQEPFGYGLAAVGKEKVLMWLNILSLGINVILNLILIPILAHIGAAITTVACIFIFLLLDYYYLNKVVKGIVIAKNLYKPLIATAIMGLVVYSLKQYNLFFIILSGAIVYLIALYLLKIFDPDEMKILKRMFKQ